MRTGTGQARPFDEVRRNLEEAGIFATPTANAHEDTSSTTTSPARTEVSSYPFPNEKAEIKNRILRSTNRALKEGKKCKGKKLTREEKRAIA